MAVSVTAAALTAAPAALLLTMERHCILGFVPPAATHDPDMRAASTQFKGKKTSLQQHD